MNTSEKRRRAHLQKMTDQEKEDTIEFLHNQRSKDVRMNERLQVIILWLMGTSISKIAKAIGRAKKTVRLYINMYMERGVEGLRMSYSTGRPSQLTDQQKEELKHTILHETPESVGLRKHMNWTAPLVREYIKSRWDIVYSVRGTLSMMHSLNLSCTRPTYTLAKADPEKQEEFKKNLKMTS